MSNFVILIKLTEMGKRIGCNFSLVRIVAMQLSILSLVMTAMEYPSNWYFLSSDRKTCQFSG
jgi:hypothetical protein